MSEEIHRVIAEIRGERNAETALHILYMSAYFVSGKKIYLDMFSGFFATSEEINSAIPLLKQKSLVESHNNDEAFVIKKVTQTAIRAYLKQISEEKRILIKAITLLKTQLVGNKLHFNRVDHALSLLSNVRKFSELLEISAPLSNAVVLTLKKQNRLEEALSFAKTALEFLKKALGEGHTQTLALQHSLGLVLGTKGKHIEAAKASKELHEKDLKYSSTYEKVQSLIMRARDLCDVCRYEEALPLYQELIGGGDVLRTFDKGVLIAWNDYGTLLSDMGRHSEAASILENVLTQKRIVETDDDPYGIATRCNLANAFTQQNNYKKALKHLKEAVFEGGERLGKLHPDTLRAERAIGLVLLNKSDFEEALKILENVEEKFKQVLENNHPEILCTRANIANTLINLKKYDRALEISQDVYKAYRNSLGEKHNETLRVKSNIGSIYLRQERRNEAVEIFREVYNGFLEIFGPEHCLTTETRATLELYGGIPQESEILRTTIQIGDLFKVINLIEKNADVNKEDLKGNKPLHYAALYDHFDIVECLLKKGAFYNAKNLSSETPLTLASGIPVKNLLISVDNLFKKVQTGNKVNITKKAELINAKDENGYSLLHWTVNISLKSTVQDLLDAGCNPKCVSLKGNTPLHIAVLNGYIDLAEILLKSVSPEDSSNFVNAKTVGKGNTALHIAAKNSDLEMVKCLLKYGAYYDIPNGERETPIQLSNSQSICDLLTVTAKFFLSFEEGCFNDVSKVITELKSLGIHNFLVVSKARNREGLTMLQVAVKNKHKYINQDFPRLLHNLLHLSGPEMTLDNTYFQ